MRRGSTGSITIYTMMQPGKCAHVQVTCRRCQTRELFRSVEESMAINRHLDGAIIIAGSSGLRIDLAPAA
jgi:hypothetical protein